MVLATLISKYLEDHRRLIIPQLGAFLVKEPDHKVLFSQLLKRDDGTLMRLIIESGATEIEASAAINRFVFDVRYALEQGESYTIEGFGALSNDDKGFIAFTALEKSTESDEEIAPEEEQDRKATEVEEVETEETTEEEREDPDVQLDDVFTLKELPIEEKPTEEPAKETTEETNKKIIESKPEEPVEAEETKEETKTPTLPKKERPQREVVSAFDPDLEGLSYKMGNSNRGRRGGKQKMLDGWMIIAIIVILLSVGVILYGWLRDGAGEKVTISMVDNIEHFDKGNTNLFCS